MARDLPGLPKYSNVLPISQIWEYRIHSILINNYYLKYHVCIVDTLFRMSMVHFIAKHFLKSDGRVRGSWGYEKSFCEQVMWSRDVNDVGRFV